MKQYKFAIHATFIGEVVIFAKSRQQAQIALSNITPVCAEWADFEREIKTADCECEALAWDCDVIPDSVLLNYQGSANDD